MRKARRKQSEDYHVRINGQIRAPEVRVLTDEEGQENMGVMPLQQAMDLAEQWNLDLVEVSDRSNPPIVKITDYGRYKYEYKKKRQEAKQKQRTTETKTVQVKPATSEGDLMVKAKNISKWLKEGHRVKLDLFLAGRSKYMEKNFLETRLERVLQFVSYQYKIADGPKKSPKGLTVILEKDSSKKNDDQDESSPNTQSDDKN